MPCDHKNMRIEWNPSPRQKKCWRKFRSVISRIPLASFVAFLMCVVGVVTYSGSLYRAVEYLLLMFAWYKVSQIVWFVMVIHIILASLFLIVAALSTGATRKDVCTKCAGCNIIGRFSQMTMIVLAYTLHFLWLLLPCIMLILVALVTGVVYLCHYVPDCIHLRDFGLTARDIEQYGPDKIMSILNSIDEEQIQQAIIKGSEIVENTAKTIDKSIPTNLVDILNNINVSNFNLDEVKKHLPPPGIINTVKNHTYKYLNQSYIPPLNLNQSFVDRLNTSQIDNSTSRQRRSLRDSEQYVAEYEKYLNYTSIFEEKLPVGFLDIDVALPSGARLIKSVRAIVARVERFEEEAEERQRFFQNRVKLLTKLAENITDPKHDIHIQLNASKSLAEEAMRKLEQIKAKAALVKTYVEDVDYASASGAENQARLAAQKSKETAQKLYALFQDSPLFDALSEAKLAERKAKATAKEVEKRVRDAIRRANETLALARAIADPVRRQQVLEQAEALKKVAEEARTAADTAREEARKTIEKAQQTVMAIAEEASDRAKNLAAEANKLANSTFVKAANRTLFNAMAAASDAAKEAQAVARKAQARAEEAVARARETARKAAQAIGKEAKEKAEAAKKAAEALMKEAKQAALSAKQQAEAAVSQAQKTVQAVAQNAAQRAREFAERARASAEATVKAAAETAMQTVIDTANKAVEVAKKAAEEAMKEAKKAAKRAEEIAKTVAKEADKVLREKAKEAEKFAREIADRAMKEAKKAMRHAHNAVEQAEKTLKAVADGALDLAKEYAAKAEQAARVALREAQKTAREVRRNAKTYAKMMTQVREKVNEIYRIVQDVARKLDIKIESGDRVCSGAKRIFCDQIRKAHVNLCVAAAAAIIINLSMVHFLMAMSANYVHITHEFEKSREPKKEEQEMKTLPDESSRFIA